MIMQFLTYIMKLCPIAVFFLLAGNIGTSENGFEMLQKVQKNDESTSFYLMLLCLDVNSARHESLWNHVSYSRLSEYYLLLFRSTKSI